MQTSRLFTLLPEEYVCTPDGMEIDKNGDLIVSCPNFAKLCRLANGLMCRYIRKRALQETWALLLTMNGICISVTIRDGQETRIWLEKEEC